VFLCFCRACRQIVRSIAGSVNGIKMSFMLALISWASGFLSPRAAMSRMGDVSEAAGVDGLRYSEILDDDVE
jgi:hypothetical protein